LKKIALFIAGLFITSSFAVVGLGYEASNRTEILELNFLEPKTIEKKSFIEFKKNAIELMPGDLFFVFNKGLINVFETNQNIQNVLFKVLKFFSDDSLETIVSMLKKELIFVTKGQNIEEDIHLLCFQRLF